MFNDKENSYFDHTILKKGKNDNKMAFNLHTGYGVSNNRNKKL